MATEKLEKLLTYNRYYQNSTVADSGGNLAYAPLPCLVAAARAPRREPRHPTSVRAKPY
jgi:hypothetical protein